MYWGALSTDIKKSSVNWNGLPTWMEKAVQYHNTVLETCVKWHKDNKENGTSVQLLPNAPEGDAYTYLFKNTSMSKLKMFVISLGTDIQLMLHTLRQNSDTKLSVSKCDKLMETIRGEAINDKTRLFNTYNLFQTKKYYGGIYIRIGIAFSDNPPIPYTFNRYRGGAEGQTSQSYRGSIITMAEKAEEKADFDLKSHIVATKIKEEPVLKECFMEDNVMKFRDIYRPEMKKEKEDVQVCNPKSIPRQSAKRRDAITGTIDLVISPEEMNNIKMQMGATDELTIAQDELLSQCMFDLENKKKQLELSTGTEPRTGFCVFVEYHPVLSDELATKNPYTKTLINKEYVDIHAKADACINQFIEINKKSYNGGLVKQKRDSTSMFVVLNVSKNMSNAQRARDASVLYQRLSELLASLPSGSSIGFAYGVIKEIKMSRPDEGTFTDYFQESVNLAARMVMRDWSFSTRWGVTEQNTHTNRLAFCSSVVKFTDKVETNIEAIKIPFTLESIPLSALNAGSNDSILCLSTKFTGWGRLKVGDTVRMKNEIGEIQQDMGDTFIVKFNRSGKQTVKRSDIRLSMGEKEVDQKEFEEFKLKL